MGGAQYWPGSIGGNWQVVVFTVVDDGFGAPVTDFTLPTAVAADVTGDPLVQVEYVSTVPQYTVDYTIAGVTLSWVSAVPLAIGETLTIHYVPA